MVLRHREDEQPFEERRPFEGSEADPERTEQFRNDRSNMLRLQREQEELEQQEPMREQRITGERPPDAMQQLFGLGEDANVFRSRWQSIQTGFVDDPSEAVSSADALVSEITNRIAQRLSEQRGQLEHEWKQSDEPTTEDLRLALQRYRSFFDRLLAS